MDAHVQVTFFFEFRENYRIKLHRFYVMNGTITAAFSLITTTFIKIVIWLDMFSTVQVQLHTTVSAIKVACVFISIALYVRSLSSLVVLLNKSEQFTTHYWLMCVLENQYVLGIIFDTFLQLIGLAVCLEVYGISAIDSV